MLARLILPSIPGAASIGWRSPLAADDYAEYRDADFLKTIGASDLADKLGSFWPHRGPQWDALGVTDTGAVLLVEAKAHIAELCSPRSMAGEESLSRIKEALGATATYLQCKPIADWHVAFYQLTNRLAHLHFLRSSGVDAWLVLVNFVGDKEVSGPSSAGEWEAAYQIVWHVLGVGKSHLLSRHVMDVYPEVRELHTAD
jgi:hypothetical protein